MNENPLLKVPPASRGNRTDARLGSPREAGGNYELWLGDWYKGTTVRHEVFEAGAIFPSASVNGQACCIALTPFVPLSRRRGMGNALQGAPPCAPTPRAHSVGEGLGVRATILHPRQFLLQLRQIHKVARGVALEFARQQFL